LRVVDGLEKIEGRAIPGLNLTFEVRDGISRHCGEKLDNNLIPSREFDLNQEALPTTLEGCLVKLVDVVGYAPQDLRDFMHACFITWADVPESITRVLGSSIRQMFDTLVQDIISTSAKHNNKYPAQKMICMSGRCFEALQALSGFNMVIIREKFGETENQVIQMVKNVYQSRKEKGEHPLQIIDHLIGLTDLQLQAEATQNEAA
jgi:dGTP triphosphohydrolase